MRFVRLFHGSGRSSTKEAPTSLEESAATIVFDPLAHSLAPSRATMKVVAIALGLFVATYVAVSSIRWAVQTHEEAATADVVPDAVVRAFLSRLFSFSLCA